MAVRALAIVAAAVAATTAVAAPASAQQGPVVVVIQSREGFCVRMIDATGRHTCPLVKHFPPHQQQRIWELNAQRQARGLLTRHERQTRDAVARNPLIPQQSSYPPGMFLNSNLEAMGRIYDSQSQISRSLTGWGRR